MRVWGGLVLTDRTLLVTGAAGFIGYHVCHRLLSQGFRVVGIDNLNDYYEVSLKTARLSKLSDFDAFEFIELDVANQDGMARLFSEHPFECVIHLAAQAGVRYSRENPRAYIDSNLVGFSHILEGCRRQKVGHLVFASSSSVYGANAATPFSEHDSTDTPISLYGATKKANEVMAHSYAYLYGLRCTGLRFFTVYGPWGRPDMAYFKFTKAIIAGKPIEIYNHGKMKRDFTYIDDVVDGVMCALKVDSKERDEGEAPYQVYNVGSSQPVPLLDFVDALEVSIGNKAVVKMQEMQAGDMVETYCDGTGFSAATGWKPSTPFHKGIRYFVNWYREYYNQDTR